MLAPAAQRQLPQPTAVEPNPPYRERDSVECFGDDPNTGRGVWNEGVIRGDNLSFEIPAAFVIANEQTGEEVERVRTDVFTTRNRAATNSVRIGDTVMYGQPRVRGIVMDKIYYVSYFNTRGQRVNSEKRTGEIRRPQGQPPQPQAAPQPQARAAAQPPRAAPQIQLPPPTAVEPNPPYRDGELVERLRDDPNTGRRVWNPARIRSEDGRIIYAFIIANEETGSQVRILSTEVVTRRGYRATNSNVRIGDTVLYDDAARQLQRVRGIVMDKVYNLGDANYEFQPARGERLNSEQRTGEIRRPGDPTPQTVVEAAAPVARPPPPPPTGPGGIAFEIHNAFDNFKIDEFMEIILMSIGRNSNFRNKTTPLKPLIDNVKANANLSASKKLDLTQKIERIFEKLRQYSNYREKLGNITACIQYVLMQPQDFIDTYIDTFITDCLKAYSSGLTESCVKGMYERIYFAFRDTVSTICLDQIQGTSAAASPLCKPEYIKIFDCFYENIPTDMLNEYSREWYSERGDEELGKLTPEARIEDFVRFVRSRMNDPVRFNKAKASIRRYANKEINTLFGGKRLSSRSKRSVRKTMKKRNIRKNKTNKKRR